MFHRHSIRNTVAIAALNLVTIPAAAVINVPGNCTDLLPEVHVLSVSEPEYSLIGSGTRIDDGQIITLAKQPWPAPSHSHDVVIFDETAEGWQQSEALTPPAESDVVGFGYGLALGDGHLLAVGHDEREVFVYARISSTWQYEATLTPTNLVTHHPTSSGSFGQVIAVGSNVAAIGASTESERGVGAGAVFVFRRAPSGDWYQETKLTASDAEPGAYFGSAVSVAGDMLVVGAPGDGDDEAACDGWSDCNAGAAYMFIWTEEGWIERTKLNPEDPHPHKHFGSSTGIANGSVLVGAWGDQEHDTRSGAVYCFQPQDAGWQQTQKIVAADIGQEDHFGRQLSAEDDRLVVSSANDDDAIKDCGAAHVFELVGDEWQQKAKLVSSDIVLGDGLGRAVGLSGTTIVCAARGTEADGRILVYDLDELETGSGCAADVNDDGAVDIDDLIEVILQWQECPADS